MVVAESPTGDLYGFDGSLTDARGRYPLTVNQLLLRGSTLRNTREVYGLVVYSGEESKIRMNSSSSVTRKAPHLEHLTNKIILSIFAGLLILAGGMTLSAYWWNTNENPDQRHWYLLNASKDYLTVFANFVVLFNAFIPISLYVSMEILKVVQVYLMSTDLAMYDEERDIPAEAHTSSLNEELGQVQYVFSDKTGTLTENTMEFRMFSVAGRSVRHYSVPEDAFPGSVDAENIILDLAEARRAGKRLSPAQQQTFDFLEAVALCHSAVPEPAGPKRGAGAVRASMIVSPEDAAILYQSSSADEVALLDAARDMFFTFKHRTPTSVSLNIMNSSVDTIYTVLETIDFTSDRKRMSTIFRYPNGRIILICKGADNVIMERLANPNPQPADPDYEIFTKTMKDTAEYAVEGLRTLLYGYRVIDPASYEAWSARYSEAATSVEDRAAKVAAVAEEIEQSLILLGATAIEDKLQAEVPETIAKLRRANIKVWMLTGDKTETAINIGHTCNLIKKDSHVLRISDEPVAGGKAPSDPIIQSIHNGVRQFMDIQKRRKENPESEDHIVVVIDGKTLTKLEQRQSANALREFLNLAISVHNVICCRFSPSQKALMVSLVKKRLSKPLKKGGSDMSELEKFIVDQQPSTWEKFVERILLKPRTSGVTLAIGDGANDIPMIESAHVGIGITGREGLAASRASDYSIAKFRFLQPLLFVHGHWSYVRNCLFTLAIFYKNVAFYGCQAVYQAFTASSSTSLYEQWTLAANNLVFTSLPVLVLAIFEKDLNRSTLMAVPELYRYGQENLGFNFRVFARWMVQGAIQAVIAVFLPAIYFGGFWTQGPERSTPLFYPTSNTFIDSSNYNWFREMFASDGSSWYQESSLFAMGTISYTISVVFCTFKILYVESHTITSVHHSIAAFSIIIWFAFEFVYPLIWPHLGVTTGVEVYGLSWFLAHTQLMFWALVVLASILGMFVIDYAVRNVVCLHRYLKAGPGGGRKESVVLPGRSGQTHFDGLVEEAETAAAYATGPHQWGKDIEWWQTWEKVHSVKSSS
ncbi:hypothetical protein DFJ73DRAFT_261869 [Zopfochytrium polystomum]|nr:hypothetical protein DFJ73DRAFT_261869 [Zopfochytrium polystomum]